MSSAYRLCVYFVLALSAVTLVGGGCDCDDGNFEVRPFVAPLKGLNTVYDEVNSAAPASLGFYGEFVFSTNAGSAGGNFDIWLARLEMQIDKELVETHEPADYPIIAYKVAPFLQLQCNSPADEFGPNLLVIRGSMSPWADLERSVLQHGLLYMFSSDRSGVGHDIFVFDGDLLRQCAFNSSGNDFYPAYHASSQSLYFATNRFGVYDIAMIGGIDSTAVLQGLLAADTTAVHRCDALSSDGDDRCPYVWGDLMLLASDRGRGTGFDIYYSRYRSGSWTAPAKLPLLTWQGTTIDVNSSANDYRPVVLPLAAQGTTDCIGIVFSSDRPRHTGDTRRDYDLYLAVLPIAVFE